MSAGTGTSLSEIERSYYMTNAVELGATLPANCKLNDAKWAFINRVDWGVVAKPTAINNVEEMIKFWLKFLCTANGVTPSDDWSALWQEVLVSQGKTPTKFTSENKRQFFKIDYSSLAF